MTSVLILSRTDIEQLLTLETLLPVIEDAFARYANREIEVFPVIREQIETHKAVYGIKSGYVPGDDALGLKAGGFWEGNPNHDLTAHQSTVLLFDVDHGTPLCLADGNFITFARTGAAGAVATRYLSRQDSAQIGLIGAGSQGRAQVLGVMSVRSVERVFVYDVVGEAAELFAQDMAQHDMEIHIVSDPQIAVKDADIVITSTPSTSAIIQDNWIKPGVHINAIGADTRGKQELDPAIFTRALVVVDDLHQAQELGECQHAITSGLIRLEDIHAELGEIVAGQKSGRQSPEEITLFDATGLAFQDLVSASLAYRLAVDQDLGQRVSL